MIENKVRKFLARNNIGNFDIKKVAGDASLRVYYRINQQNKESLILMDASLEKKYIKPFIHVDELLKANNFLAPKIYDYDLEEGYILLEDFGDTTLTKYLEEKKSQLSIEEFTKLEFNSYKDICNILLNIAKIDINKESYLSKYSNYYLFNEVMLFVDWYIPYKNNKISKEEKSSFKKIWFELFDLLGADKQVLVLRDFHAENIMISSSHGLLDFQDALVGSPAYDLVSLIEDARRDIDQGNAKNLIDYYLTNIEFDKDNFTMEYKILSLQRNLKILGIFARLYLRDNKDRYLSYMPRVENYVKKRLESDIIFAKLYKVIEKFI